MKIMKFAGFLDATVIDIVVYSPFNWVTSSTLCRGRPAGFPCELCKDVGFCLQTLDHHIRKDA